MAEGMIWIRITPISKAIWFICQHSGSCFFFVYLIFGLPVKLNRSHDVWFVYDLYDFSIKNIFDNGTNHQLLAYTTGLIFVSLFRYFPGHVHND